MDFIFLGTVFQYNHETMVLGPGLSKIPRASCCRKSYLISSCFGSCNCATLQQQHFHYLRSASWHTV